MKEHNDEIIQDMFGSYKLLLLVTGLAHYESVKYRLYKAIIMIVYIYLQAVSLVAVVLVDKNMSVLCLHTFLISFYSAYVLTMRSVCSKSVQKCRDMLLSGIYHYDGEEEDMTMKEMRCYAIYDIKRRTRVVAITYGVLAGYNLIIMPLQMVLTSKDDEAARSDEVLNKNLPYPMYTPFNSHTLLGYTVGMIFCTFYCIGGFGGGVTFIYVYLNCALQLVSQLRILNYSLKNIHNRAYLKFIKRGTHAIEKLTEEIYRSKDFQACMFSCLRANVIHHQTLLRFLEVTQPFIGTVYFITAALGSLSYACSLYLLLQDPPLELIISLGLTLFAEFAYNYFICYVGQEVIDEAVQLRNSLYSTSWYLCDKSFNQVIDVIMRYTFNPLTITSTFLNFPASVEQFGNATSAMYKIANLVT